jgi:hypothetical protein
MSSEKYTSISLPKAIIQELDRWQEAYKLAGEKITKGELLEQMMENSRRFLWRNKKKRKIITCYKALQLEERDGIDINRAYKKVKAHDKDTNTTSHSYNRISNYVYDKSIDEIK